MAEHEAVRGGSAEPHRSLRLASGCLARPDASLPFEAYAELLDLGLKERDEVARYVAHACHLEDASVLRVAVVFGIREHTPDFRICTEIIAFMVAAVGVPERIGREVNGTLVVAGAGNPACQEPGSVDDIHPYIFLAGQADTDLFLVVRTVPKILFIACHSFFRESVQGERAVFLLYPEHYDTAVRIGKG